MPIRKSQPSKEKKAVKKENLIVKFVRRAVFFALVVTCAALYWQDTNLSSENRTLTERLNVAAKRLAKFHQDVPADTDQPASPAEAAQLHLARAKDALSRNDYATAIAESERAGTDVEKATQNASAESRDATRSLTTSLNEVRQKIATLTGNASRPPYQSPKPSDKAHKEVQ